LKDYYNILGLKRDASQDEIKKAWRQLAKKHHPDSNPDNRTAETDKIFSDISEAYDTLSSKSKKVAYDAKLSGNSDTVSGKDNRASGASGQSSGGRSYNPSDFAKTSTMFEGFFGFNPKTKEPSPHYQDDKIKPMKTKDAYEHIFGKKRF